jgi:hypothetical protein
VPQIPPPGGWSVGPRHLYAIGAPSPRREQFSAVGQAVISKGDVVAFLNRRLRRLDIALIRHSELWRTGESLGRQPRPAPPPPPARPPLLAQFGVSRASFDAAVVMPTLLRPTIAEALRSVFAQDFPGTIQVLVGVDVPEAGGAEVVADACRDRPDRCTVLLLDPGYSTSVRHGGQHASWDGGVLRVVLSYLAASRRVAYLDDDNFWAPGHLSSVARALAGHDFAWSERVAIDRHTRAPGETMPFEGFVDPNCLILDKLACEAVLRWWGLPKRDSRTGADADRHVSRFLLEAFSGRATGEATVFYAVRDPLPPD